MKETKTSTVIVGAGPAGLQLAYFLEKAGRDYVVLERSAGAGAFFSDFPRHRTLISSNKVYTGYADPERRMRFDWNSLLTDDYGLLFQEYSKRYFAPAEAMVRYLQDFAQRYVPRIHYGVTVTQVKKDREFVVATAAGDIYRCDRLVVATGNARAYLPNIAGIELVESYVDVSTTPEDFCDQRVLIIGKGNSGFETAENLIETAAVVHIVSPHSVKFAWATHYPGHLRAVNNNFLDTYQLKTQNAVLDAEVQQISRTGDGKLLVQLAYSHAGGETEAIVYDRVIACTGFRFDTSIFDESCRPALAINDRFPAQTSSWESVNVRGLFFAGALTQMRDFKKTNSAFVHGFRYNTRALFRILEEVYEGCPWPVTQVSRTPQALANAALDRVNRSSALWQQFGFLCDVLAVPQNGGDALLYEALPADYFREQVLGAVEHCYTISLEFGKHQPDPFHIVREVHPDRADQSAFLHPVIRGYRQGRQTAEIHLLENLFGEWENEELHRCVLRKFFAADEPCAGFAA